MCVSGAGEEIVLSISVLAVCMQDKDTHIHTHLFVGTFIDIKPYPAPYLNHPTCVNVHVTVFVYVSVDIFGGMEDWLFLFFFGAFTLSEALSATSCRIQINTNTDCLLVMGENHMRVAHLADTTDK